MLLLSAHHLARAEVVYVFRAEERFRVTGAEGAELLQFAVHLLSDVPEVYYGVDVERRLGMLGAYMLLHILLEASAELLHVVPSQSQSGGIRMSAEIHQQVAAALYSRVYVEARHAACRTRCQVAVARQNNGRPYVYLREP